MKITKRDRQIKKAKNDININNPLFNVTGHKLFASRFPMVNLKVLEFLDGVNRVKCQNSIQEFQAVIFFVCLIS